MKLRIHLNAYPTTQNKYENELNKAIRYPVFIGLGDDVTRSNGTDGCRSLLQG